jgi:TonB-dependent starch-binding outer membrane protein SusC
MKRLILVFMLLLTGAAALEAQRAITGMVTDEKGEALIGASVLAKGTSVGTVSDLDGSFRLQIPAGANALVVSYTGYVTKEVALTNASSYEISLSSDIVGISEIVVVGYGTQQKRDVTGSISQVKGDAIANLATPSFESQLAGRAAGVQITPPSGILGSPPQIRIRGVNSISSGTGPLIVLDGVPVVSGNAGGFTPANTLGDINPADIESFEILKDGAATAIYGSRAANGVILITTKKGKSGKAKFAYDAYVGVSQATNLFPLLNAQQFVEINNEKNRNAGGTTDIANLQTRADGSIVETDWNDVIFRNAFQQNHVFSVSGGTDKNSYYFSFGFSDQEGIAVSNSLNRYSFRANLDQKVNNWLKVGFSSGVTRQQNLGPLTGSNNLSGNTFSTIRMFPNVEVYDPTDPTGYNLDDINPRTLGRGANTIEIANGIPNQRFVLDNDARRSDSWRLLGNAYVGVQIAKGLDFRSQIGIDGSYVDDYLFQDPRHGDGFSANGRISQAYSPQLRWNWQNILNYTETFGEKHNLGLTLVQEYQKQRGSFYQTQVSDLSDRFFKENIITGTYVNQQVFGGISENGIASYMGRVNYNFARKYYISASIRRDALSSLPPEGRVGYFPGASFAWRVSEESFWGGLSNVISDFRLRGSFAKVGNTAIPGGNYPYIGSYGSALYGTQTGIGYNNFGNDGLRWESQQKYDFGFDLGLLDNRINASVAYWIQDNDDIILQAPTPPSVGIPGNVINQNIGRVKNQGIEFTVDATVLRSNKLRWNMAVNFTTQRNEVLGLVDGQDITEEYTIIRVGESLRSIYGFNYWGVNPANGNPVYEKIDGRLVQQNIVTGGFNIFDPGNPGTIGDAATLSTATDRRVLGSALPKWFGGVDNNFSFGNFDANFFIRFSGGNMIMNRTRADLVDQGFNNNGTEILGRWQSPENPGDGITPRLRLNATNTVNNPNVAHTRFVEKGDFLRVGNISVGYTLPRSLAQKLSIENLRIFAQAQNAFTFTSYTGTDPETNTNGFGVDFNGNPQQRVYSFGVNLGF